MTVNASLAVNPNQCLMMTEYRIHLAIKLNTHPRKWLIEGINDMLDDNEDILEWEIEPMNYSENNV